MIGKLMDFFGLQDEQQNQEELDQDVIDQEEELFPSRKQKNNIVSIHSQKNMKIVLSEPRSYEETQEIADHLRSHRPVVVNLQRLSTDNQGRRVVDFLSGCVYALNGNIKKIGPHIFFCTPENVNIEGAITELMQEEREEVEVK